MSTVIESLSGGLPPEKDLVFPARPQHPEMRESVSVWLFEESGAFALPRVGIEAEASSWENRRLQFNFAFTGGRVLNGAGRGPAACAFDSNGRASILGAGPLTFQCVEPFRKWRMSFDGPALDGHVSEQIRGIFGQSRRTSRVRLRAEMTMVTPAWVQENPTEAATLSGAQAADAAAMGLGTRFEHLFRARGTVELDDGKRDFTATGVRIHRQSIRRLEGFAGHCWLSALFPDGRAFGCLAYPPRSDGSEGYNDAVIYESGRLIAARLVKTPFLRRIVAAGDDVSLELESELGRTRIDGVTTLSTFRIGNPEMGGLNLQQGAALFTWDGQRAFGMVERSSHESLTRID